MKKTKNFFMYLFENVIIILVCDLDELSEFT